LIGLNRRTGDKERGSNRSKEEEEEANKKKNVCVNQQLSDKMKRRRQERRWLAMTRSSDRSHAQLSGKRAEQG
jgi:hypothetical protein